MKRIFYFLAVVMCQMAVMTVSAQNLSGKWCVDNIVDDLGDGVMTHTSGVWSFDSDGVAKAEYRVIGTMAQDGESVYIDLVITGSGKYSVADGTLNVKIDNPEKAFKMGKGTYDNMGPAYEAKGATDNMMVTIFGSALYAVFSQKLTDFELKNMTIGSDKIEGIWMETPVTLTKTDQTKETCI